MLAVALRRLALLVLSIATATVLVSLALGLAFGAGALRSISVGLYLVGSFWLVSGFFVGNRGPVRLKNDLGVTLFGSRFVRWATPEEREETINMSALYVVLGLVLVILGAATDTRHKLF